MLKPGLDATAFQPLRYIDDEGDCGDRAHTLKGMFAGANDSNGHPTMLVMDEAWVYLANEYFAKRIDDWLRTLRKKRVAVVHHMG